MPTLANMVDAEAAATATLSEYRNAVRRRVTSLRWEMGMMMVVIVYCIVVFGSFDIEDKQIARFICGEWITPECRNGLLDDLDFAFNTFDLSFLWVFEIEIEIKEKEGEQEEENEKEEDEEERRDDEEEERWR